MVAFLTGTLGEFLDRNFESDIVKRMFLANNVYGMHAAPYPPGTAIGLLFHLLSGGDQDVQGFFGHVIGRHGRHHPGHGGGGTGVGRGDRDRRAGDPDPRPRTGGPAAWSWRTAPRSERHRGVERRSQADVPRPGGKARRAGGVPASV